MLLTHAKQKSRNFGNEKQLIEKLKILDRKLKLILKIGFFA
jgi:hypothetical protein